MPAAPAESLIRTRSGRRLAVLVAVVWLALVVAGAVLLGRYDVSPGAQVSAPRIWPPASHLPGPAQQPVLLCFIHPHCPCSVATLTRLADIRRQADGTLRIVVVVARAGQIPGSRDGRADRAARGLVGVEVIDDPTGAEARRFGIATSGDCLLYATSGRLLFHGGVTASRGHEGPSRGGAAVLALVDDRIARSDRAVEAMPVYGCGIADP